VHCACIAIPSQLLGARKTADSSRNTTALQNDDFEWVFQLLE